MLTADSHVHSEWSWDTGGPDSDAQGTMERTCERAVRIGLPALIFTEHLDFDDRWSADIQDFPPAAHPYINSAGYLTAPPLDVDGYFGAIEQCRHQFPELTILSGVEFGQPHLFEDAARALVDLDRFDRINGSLHTVQIGQDRAEPVTLYRLWEPEDVISAYLDEVPKMIAGSEVFEVFTHIDYAARHWPTAEAGPFDPKQFEDGFRSAHESHCRQRPRPGDEHPTTLAMDAAVVEGRRRSSRVVRQRRPRSAGTRRRFPGGRLHAGTNRLPSGNRSQDLWTC